MATEEIESEYHGHTGVRSSWGDVNTVPGMVLNMTNGQVWFHPDSGAKPFRLPEREAD